jgi:hypothetical protein
VWWKEKFEQKLNEEGKNYKNYDNIDGKFKKWKINGKRRIYVNIQLNESKTGDMKEQEE